TQDTDKQDTDTQGTKETAVAPSWEFTAADLEGNEVTQDILKEKKLTMVNYWATFCGPCLREMPELGELNEEYADKGFQIVGVITDAYRDQEGDHNIDVAQEVVDSTKASYVHLPLTLELLGGPVGSVQAVPTTIFVDENGNQVGDIQVGSKSKEDWAKLIDAYLELV
ncbi:MAG: TlpA disulfide reductase family protein, partial [Eubacteriales bacterium]|nr:TlpA disulfide reductase family protein [Eubacteriales bacterium]